MSSTEFNLPPEIDEDVDVVAPGYVEKMGDLQEEIEQIPESGRTTKEIPTELDSEDFTVVPREDQE